MTDRLKRILDLGIQFRRAQEEYLRNPSPETLRIAHIAVANFDREAAGECTEADASILHAGGLNLRRLQQTWKLTRTSVDQIKMVNAQYRFDDLLRRKKSELAKESLFTFAEKGQP